MPFCSGIRSIWALWPKQSKPKTTENRMTAQTTTTMKKRMVGRRKTKIKRTKKILIIGVGAWRWSWSGTKLRLLPPLTISWIDVIKI